MPAGVGVATGSLPEHRALLPLARDYLALTKPRIIGLLLVTTVATMLVADPSGPGLATILWTVLGGYLAAGGAGAVNHYLERERDARMDRTCGRPLVSGRIDPRNGLWFGVFLVVAATIELGVTVNDLAAVLALAGFLGYIVVYTVWLKPRTPAEHRHRRSRRSRAATRRLGSRHRRPELGRALSIRDRLPVDAAPLLGARPADQR